MSEKDGNTGDPRPSNSLPGRNMLTVVDHRTGDEYEIPITDDSIPAKAFADMKSAQREGNAGLLVFDPAYTNTAVARSAISFIDGERGLLEYRGYPIEELAEKSTFLEVAYLLIYEGLPSAAQAQRWRNAIAQHFSVPSRLMDLVHTFSNDAHPMGVFISAMAAMGTYYVDANPAVQGSDIFHLSGKNPVSSNLMNKHIAIILACAPTIAAAAYRHRIGRPFRPPQSGLGFTENLLYMMDVKGEAERGNSPHPVLIRALDVMFILHADHEMNCSTSAMRHISSSRADPYSSLSGAVAALYGPLHGGANEAVLTMLEDIGSVSQVPVFISLVKRKEKKLMGFGHRVYRNYDPRARIIQQVAYEVFKVCGHDPLVEIAVALEQAALQDTYFIKRKLYPNVDFYSGLIYKAMGFPTNFFPLLFAIPRTAGYLAHWRESMQDDSPKIWRPRQVYVGHRGRSYVAEADRVEDDASLSVADHRFRVTSKL